MSNLFHAFSDAHQVAPTRPQRGMSEPINLALVGIAGYGLALATNLLLSRHMSPAMFGDYNVAFAVLAALSELALAGTETAAGRFIPHIRHSGDLATLSAYISWNFGRIHRAFLFVIASYVLLLLALAIADVLGFRRFNDYHLIFYSLWIAPLAAWTLLLAKYLVATDHDIVGGLLATLAPNALILGFVAMVIWSRHLLVSSAFVIVAIWAVTFAILAIAELAVLQQLSPVIYGAIMRFRRSSIVDSVSEWAQASNSMLVSRISGLLLWYMELIVIEIAARRESSVGLYAAALLVARALRLVPNYVMYMVTPLVGADYDDSRAYPELQRGIDRANIIVFAVSVLILAIIFTWTRTILGIFGSEFQGASTALELLAVGAFVAAVTRQSRTILMLSGGERIVSKLSAATLFILVAAGIPVARVFSINGLALVSCITLVGQGIAFYAFARRHLPAIRPLSLV